MTGNDNHGTQDPPASEPKGMESAPTERPEPEQLQQDTPDAGTDGSRPGSSSTLQPVSGSPTSDENSKGLEALEGEIADIVTGRLLEVVTASQSSMSSWTGPMPSPQDMREYQAILPDATERLFAIHESQTIGYTNRMDKLVEAEVKEAEAGRVAAVSLMVLCMIGSALFFAFGNQIAGGAFLSLPVLGFIKQLLPDRGSKSSKKTE